MKIAEYCFFLLFVVFSINAKVITIRNDQPRFDKNSEIIDAHDGCLMSFNNTYYLYGTGYNSQNGFTPYNKFVCYSSPDLENWTNHGDVLPETGYENGPLWGIYYRPHVIYNPRTRHYVLFYNWYPWGTGWTGYLGVAVADDPWGPFVVADAYAATTGDFAAFSDDDSSGYAVYGWHGGNAGRLSEDYLSVLPGTTPIGSGEAWGIFKRSGKYYAVGGNLCCFCYAGAAATAFMADSAMGPYAAAGTLGGIEAQHAFVAELATAGGPQYVYAGDMWQHTPAGYPALKGYDILYLGGPLQFDGSGNVLALPSFQANWTIDITEGPSSPGPAVARNLALGKSVTSSSSLEGSGWSDSMIVDGRCFSQAAYMGWKSDTTGGPEWIQADLGAVCSLKQVVLYPITRTEGAGGCGPFTQDNLGEGFPTDFSIKVSRDSSSWKTVAVKTAYPNPGSQPQAFSFPLDSGRWVRVETSNKTQLAEIVVYGHELPLTHQLKVDTRLLQFSADTNYTLPEDPIVALSNAGDSVPPLVITPDDSWLMVSVSGSGSAQIIHHSVDITGLAENTTYATRVSVSAPGFAKTSYGVKVTVGSANLAYLKPVSALSTVSFTGWALANLVDGLTTSNASSLGWSSWSSTSVDHTEWVCVDLGDTFNITRIVLYPRADGANANQGFPRDFTLMAALDSAGTWSSLASFTAYPVPDGGQTFSFTAQQARFVKVLATSLDTVEASYVMQFAEMEVYGRPGPGSRLSPKNQPISTARVFAFPNPFNPSVNIRYELPANVRAEYGIFNMAGKLVFHATLSPGTRGVLSWNGRDAQGAKVPAGCYLGKMTIEGGKGVSQKIVLLK